MNNKELESEFDRLTGLNPTRPQMTEYFWAIKSLSDGLTKSNVWDIFRSISLCQRYLSEFKGKFIKSPDLNEKEAEVARGLHSYMRKSMDSALSVMLYRMISENRGISIWWAFVKGLVASKCNYYVAVATAQAQCDVDNTTDNILMLQALRMWGSYENFPAAIEWLKSE